MFTPAAADVRRALERLGATPAEVGRVLRAWAFSWRDDEGVLVVAVFADRLAELDRLRLRQRVLLHERRDVAGAFGSEEAHDRDVEVVQRAIRAAQVAAGGRGVAVLGGLPRGWSEIGGERPVLVRERDRLHVAAVTYLQHDRRRSRGDVAHIPAPVLRAYLAAVDPPVSVSPPAAPARTPGSPGSSSSGSRRSRGRRRRPAPTRSPSPRR